MVFIWKSAPVQTGPGAHPTSYTMGTGSFPGVKWSGRGVDHEKDGKMYVPYIVCFFFSNGIHMEERTRPDRHWGPTKPPIQWVPGLSRG